METQLGISFCWNWDKTNGDSDYSSKELWNLDRSYSLGLNRTRDVKTFSTRDLFKFLASWVTKYFAILRPLSLRMCSLLTNHHTVKNKCKDLFHSFKLSVRGDRAPNWNVVDKLTTDVDIIMFLTLNLWFSRHPCVILDGSFSINWMILDHDVW